MLDAGAPVESGPLQLIVEEGLRTYFTVGGVLENFGPAALQTLRTRIKPKPYRTLRVVEGFSAPAPDEFDDDSTPKAMK